VSVSSDANQSNDNRQAAKTRQGSKVNCTNPYWRVFLSKSDWLQI